MTAGYLLDTNVISATAPDRRAVPDAAKQAARAWILAHEAELYLPVTALAEIAAGIGMREAVGATSQARALADWLRGVLQAGPTRILALDAEAALQARRLMRRAREAGVTPGFADLSIACIAAAHDLAVATRNLKDFAPMGVPAVDPFAV